MKANKLMGQNFLTSQKVVEDIIKASDIKSDDVILEVGPGKGFLTEALLSKVKKGGKVIAVEKDQRLFEFLQKRFSQEIENGKLELILGDILKYDVRDLIASIKKAFQSPKGGEQRCEKSPLGGGAFSLEMEKVVSYKVVANIPYYLTSHLLRKFLESEKQPEIIVVMVQKEVAERIACFARRGCSPKESVLSVSIKIYGEPEIVRLVGAEHFKPKPKVDSAVLKIKNISRDFFTKNRIEEKDFFKVVKTGFLSRRKKLKNNLSNVFAQDVVLDSFDKCGIEDGVRAEHLNVQNWACLSKELKQKTKMA